MTRSKKRPEFVTVERTDGLALTIRLSSIAFMGEKPNGDWEVVLTNFTTAVAVPAAAANLIRVALAL